VRSSASSAAPANARFRGAGRGDGSRLPYQSSSTPSYGSGESSGPPTMALSASSIEWSLRVARIPNASWDCTSGCVLVAPPLDLGTPQSTTWTRDGRRGDESSRQPRRIHPSRLRQRNNAARMHRLQRRPGLPRTARDRELLRGTPRPGEPAVGLAAVSTANRSVPVIVSHRRRCGRRVCRGSWTRSSSSTLRFVANWARCRGSRCLVG